MVLTQPSPGKLALFSTQAFNLNHLGSIYIPTKDRPKELARLLASFEPAWFVDFLGTIIIASMQLLPDTSLPMTDTPYTRIEF